MSKYSGFAIGVAVVIVLLLVAIVVIVAVILSRTASKKCAGRNGAAVTTMLSQTDTKKSCVHVWSGVNPLATIKEFHAEGVAELSKLKTSSHTGICIPVASPTGENYASDIDAMVNFISSIPSEYRVGFTASIQDTKPWRITLSEPPKYALTKCGKEGACASSTLKLICDPDDPLNPVAPTGTGFEDPYACRYVSYYKGPGNTDPTYKPTHCAINQNCVTPSRALQFAPSKDPSHLDCDIINPSGPFGNSAVDKHACWFKTQSSYKPTNCALSGTCLKQESASPPSPADLHKCPSAPAPPFADNADDTSACWYVVSAGVKGTVHSEMFPPGFSSTTIQFAGGCSISHDGPCRGSVKDSRGAPYQVFGSQIQGGCEGLDCPGNASRLGWYVALVNAKLRANNSQQRISMLYWDANTKCEIFQFLYALRQFGVTEDILPPVGGVNVPWIIYNTKNSSTACGKWGETPINLVTNPNSTNTFKNVSTYSDMVQLLKLPC